MPRALITRILVVAGALTFVESATAQAVQESFGTEYRTTALTGFDTRGVNMVGMRVTGYMATGAVTSTWGAIAGSGSNILYGVRNADFQVYLPANQGSSNAIWFTTVFRGAMSRLEFNGAPGNTVFDRWFNFTAGTPGSANGSDIFIEPRDIWNTTVTYRNAVGVGGNAPVGDLFETMDITYGTAVTGGFFPDFRADTDNSALNSPITPAVTATPEPASLALLATGLVAVAAGRRRRRA